MILRPPLPAGLGGSGKSPERMVAISELKCPSSLPRYGVRGDLARKRPAHRKIVDHNRLEARGHFGGQDKLCATDRRETGKLAALRFATYWMEKGCSGSRLAL